MSSDGGILLRASTSVPNIINGVWTGDSSGFALHVQTGDAAPGMPAGATFAQFYNYSIGDAEGTIILKARASGGGLTAADDEGVWVGPPGALSLVYREGDQAPGLASGVLMGPPQGTTLAPLINHSGLIAVQTRLTGMDVTFDNDLAIVAGIPGQLTTILRTGAIVPNTGNGVIFGLPSYAISDSGHVVVLANLANSEIGATSALYSWSPCEGLTQLITHGDLVDLGGALGEQPIQNGVNFVGTGNLIGSGEEGAGYATGLGQNGHFAVQAFFPSGQGGIVTGLLGDTGCAADLNEDGEVSGGDLAALLTGWGPCAMCSIDLNCNGEVSGSDLAALLAAWGPCN